MSQSQHIGTLSPASPRLIFRVADTKRGQQIRSAYTFIRSFRIGGRGDWNSIRPTFNSPQGIQHVFVQTVTSFHDPFNRRMLFGVSFTAFVPSLPGDSGNRSKAPNPIARDESEAFARAAEIIIKQVTERFPGLGIKDVSASFRLVSPTNPKRRLIHGSAFHLILEISLVAR